MSTDPNSERIVTQQIVFEPGQTAVMMQVGKEVAAAQIVNALKLPPYEEVIVVIGGAKGIADLKEDDPIRSRIVQLCSRGIARAAIATKAVIIDGGTDSGVMHIMGTSVADRGRKTPLIGVAPRGTVTLPGGTPTPDCPALEPNHTHFVLVPGTRFGDESATIAAIADALVNPKKDKPAVPPRAAAAKETPPPSDGSQEPEAQPVKGAAEPVNEKTALVVLFGGGEISKSDILIAVRRNFPIVVIDGTGGLADDVAKYCRDKPMVIADAALAEIIEEGNIHIFDQKRPVASLEPLIIRELGGNHSLDLAWRRYAEYDQQAIRFQSEFHTLQKWVLRLGVALTACIALKASAAIQYAPDRSVIVPWWIAGLAVPNGLKSNSALIFDSGLHLAILILPIVTAGLLAYSGYFKSGVRWIVFRAGAEAIKRAIYIYRTRPPSYRAKPENAGQQPAPGDMQAQEEVTREKELQRAVERITAQLMQSEANASGFERFTGAVPPGIERQNEYGGSQDDGLCFLTPENYIRARLDDQISFYRSRSVRLENELRRWQILALLAGGLGTFLAALNVEIWVAVTTAFASACITFLEYRQTRMTLVQYNQAAANLGNVKQWWYALSPEDQADGDVVRRLVETTEDISTTEQAGWAQQMQNALVRLDTKQVKKPTGPNSETEEPDR